MRIDEYSAEQLSAYITEGQRLARGVAMEILGDGLCEGDPFNRVFEWATRTWHGKGEDLNQLPVADRGVLLGFAVYGMFRMRLSYMRQLRLIADQDPAHNVDVRDALNALLAELESLV